MTNLFLVLILSLSGSYSSFVPAINKQYHNYLMVAEDKSQTFRLQENFGIIPLITKCEVFRKTEQVAPNFAGARLNFLPPNGKNVAGNQQKLKLVGLMEMRNAITPRAKISISSD